jgi:hypothetical protein
MTMKRILHCTLIFMVLVTSGCGFFSDDPSPAPGANPSPSPQARNTPDFKETAEDVRRALAQLNSSGRTGQPQTVGPVKQEINKALQKLGKDEDELRERCTTCNEKAKADAIKVLQVLTAIRDDLGPDSRKVAELGEDAKEDLQEKLKQQTNILDQLNAPNPKPTEAASARPTMTTVSGTNEDTGDPWWSDTLILSAKIVAALLALFLLLTAVTYLWKYSWRTLETNVARMVKAHVAATREAPPDYTAKLSSLASTQAETNSKLSELDTEVRSLARFVRESLARRPDRSSSYDGSNYQSAAEDASLRDEPEFPVSAVDYLGKMTRFANVVRPDFQNGILVHDPEGSGELVLIKDPRVRDDTQPLFVVPRATQFHTKQDFYTYYQKYYDCVKPSAGDVWILGPAVVEKVTGGWQLREKGMLEIR